MATSALITEISLEGALLRVVQVAAEVIGARYAAIGVLAPDGKAAGELHHVRDRLPSTEPASARRRGATAFSDSSSARPRPIRLPDLTQHPDSYGFPPHHPPMHSFLGVPIVGRRGVFGNLYLTEKTGGEVFTEEDEHIAVLLAARPRRRSRMPGCTRRAPGCSRRSSSSTGPGSGSSRWSITSCGTRSRRSTGGRRCWSGRRTPRRSPAPRSRSWTRPSRRSALINDLLDLSRLDEDRLKPVIRAVEPAAVARRAIGRVTPAAEAKQVKLELDAGAGSAELRDRRQPGRADPRQPARQRDPAYARSGSTVRLERHRRGSGDRLSRWRTGARDPARASWSGSSTSMSPRPATRAAGSGSGSRSPVGWPGCSAASSARWPDPGGRALRSGASRRANHEEIFMLASDGFRPAVVDSPA